MIINVVRHGETLKQFDGRINQGLIGLFDEYATKRVLLVCHGFVGRVINRQCNNLAYDEMHDFSLDNCQIAEYLLAGYPPS